MQAEDYTIIDQYLRNQLAAEDRQAFEARLAREPELAEALEFARHAHAFLGRQVERDALKTQLKRLGDQHFQGQGSQPPQAKGQLRRLWPVLAIAATVALILTINFLLPQPSLYDQFGQHQPLFLTEKSTDAPNTASMEAAFNNGKYGEALPLLQAYTLENPTDTLALLYQGICLLETNQLPAATNLFAAIQQGQSALKPEAIWYLALTALKEEKPVQCRQWLQTIPAESDRYQAAQDLLKKL